jgi:hypothetical protein
MTTTATDDTTTTQQAILAKKRFEEEQEKEKEDQKKRLLEQYGADKFLAKKADPRLLLGQTEAWVEYSKDGRVIKGAPRAIARSKYQVRLGWFGGCADPYMFAFGMFGMYGL